MLLLYGFLVLLLIPVLYWFVKMMYYNWYLGHLPWRWALPIIGNTWTLLFCGYEGIIPLLSDMMLRCGTSYRMVLGFDTYVVVCDPKFLEFVLSSMTIIKKNVTYKFLSSWLGNGLLTSTGSYWKRQRRIITPTFHFKILEQFLEVFHHNSDVMVRRLQCEVGIPSVDVYPYVTNCTLDVICESAMGISVNAQEHSESDYVRAVKDMCRITIERSISAVQQFDWLYKFTSNYRAEKKNLKILHTYTNKVVQDRRKLLLKNIIRGEALQSIEGYNTLYDDAGIKKRFAFLDVLLQARTPEGDALTNTEIRQEVDTFMFEGHDTTSSAVSFCLYSLSQNPNIQENVVEELRTIFNRCDDQSVDGFETQSKAATYQNLQDMKYLDLVIKETLRMYPSVPGFGRILTSDMEYDGHVYPAGLQLLIYVIGVQNNPAYFPEPNKFNPERFNDPNQASKSPYLYVPFSAGPRNCIGQKFALLELKSLISKVLRYFELLPAVPERKPILLFETVLKSSNGLHVQLKKRKW